MSAARLREVVRFCVVGGGCFLLDYGLLYVLTEYGGLPYLWSSGLSFTASVFVNYWLCVVYVFRASGGQTGRQKALFFGSSIAGLFLNQVCMYVFVDLCGIYYMIAKLLATAIVTIWNYVMKRKALAGKADFLLCPPLRGGTGPKGGGSPLQGKTNRRNELSRVRNRKRSNQQ